MEQDKLIMQRKEAALKVRRHLKTGYLESVYQRALLYELRLRGLNAIGEAVLPVFYKNECVGGLQG